jgi:hypothetical protein
MGFVGLIRMGFQDVRDPTVQLAQLLSEFLYFGVVCFCRYVARQFIQILQRKTVKRPLARAGHDAQTIRKVVAGKGVFHDQVTLALGQLQRNLFAGVDSLPMSHRTSVNGLSTISPFELPRSGELKCGRFVCDLNHNFAVWQGYGLFGFFDLQYFKMNDPRGNPSF